MGVGPYVNYKGYFCPKCKTARSDLDKHYANRHKHVDQTTERYKRMRDANVIDFTNWTTVLQKFESDLITDGGGTGNPCSKADAHRYHKQILKLIPHKETLRDFLGVFENLQNAVDKSKDGYISTQHAYVVTLLKFLRYLRSRNYDVVTKTYLQNFTERAKQWKKGLRMKRKKREEEFNLKESVELTDEVDPFTAILRYERSTFHNEICSYRNDHHTNTDAKKLRLVYADIFARIICRQGTRGSSIHRMTVDELRNVDKRKNGQLKICVKDPKGVCLAYIGVEENELQELRRTSELGWRFWNISEPNLKDVAFPAVSDRTKTGQKMTSTYFSNLLILVFSRIYPTTYMTTTRVRKMIKKQLADKNLEIREKLVQASRGNVVVGRKHNDLRNERDNVDAARESLKPLAAKGIWSAFVLQGTSVT